MTEGMLRRRTETLLGDIALELGLDDARGEEVPPDYWTDLALLELM